MNITDIFIKNFRGVKHFSATEIPNRTMFLGFNGAGKTTILDAVRAVFDGRVRFRDTSVSIGKRSSMASALIGPDGDCAEVQITATHEGQTVFARLKISAKPAVLEVNIGGEKVAGNDPDEIRAALCLRLGINRPRLACGLSPAAYLTGDGVDEMIAELGGGIDEEQFILLTQPHVQWMEEFAGKNYHDTSDLESLAKLGDSAFMRRTGVKKEIKEVEALIESIGFIPQPKGKNGELTTEDRPAINKQLARLRVDRDGLLRERGRIESARTQAQIYADIAVLENEIASASERIGEAKKEADSATEEATKARSEHEAALKSLNDARLTDAEMASTQRQRKAILDELSTVRIVLDNECPTCGTKITAAIRQRLEDTLRANVATAQAELELADSKREITQCALSPLAEIEEAARKKISVAAQESADAAMRLQSIEIGVDSIKRRVQDLRKEQPASGTVADVDAQIAGVEEKIGKAESALEALGKIAELEGAKARKAELEAEKEHLEWAVTGFRDGVITRQITSGAQDKFTEKVNEILSNFKYQIAIEGDTKHPRVMVCDLSGSGEYVSAGQISEGEFLILQWAVAAAFVENTPILLDNFNDLCGVNKPLFISSLDSAPAGLWLASAHGRGTAPDVDDLAAALEMGVQWIGDK